MNSPTGSGRRRAPPGPRASPSDWRRRGGGGQGLCGAEGAALAVPARRLVRARSIFLWSASSGSRGTARANSTPWRPWSKKPTPRSPSSTADARTSERRGDIFRHRPLDLADEAKRHVELLSPATPSRVGRRPSRPGIAAYSVGGRSATNRRCIGHCELVDERSCCSPGPGLRRGASRQAAAVSLEQEANKYDILAL